MNTKPFDLEAAKRGAPICQRDGKHLRLVAVVAESKKYPVWCVRANGEQIVLTLEGNYWAHGEYDDESDAFMVVNTKTVWVNLYKAGDCVITGCLNFSTEQEAKECDSLNVLRTVSVEVPV